MEGEGNAVNWETSGLKSEALFWKHLEKMEPTRQLRSVLLDPALASHAIVYLLLQFGTFLQGLQESWQWWERVFFMGLFRFVLARNLLQVPSAFLGLWSECWVWSQIWRLKDAEYSLCCLAVCGAWQEAGSRFHLVPRCVPCPPPPWEVRCGGGQGVGVGEARRSKTYALGWKKTDTINRH